MSGREEPGLYTDDPVSIDHKSAPVGTATMAPQLQTRHSWPPSNDRAVKDASFTLLQRKYSPVSGDAVGGVGQGGVGVGVGRESKSASTFSELLACEPGKTKTAARHMTTPTIDGAAQGPLRVHET